MWRSRAVQEMLIGEVAQLPVAREEPAAAGGTGGEAGASLAVLAGAQRRAITVVALLWLALGLLLVLRPAAAGPFLATAGEEAVFTTTVLLVAVYSGFRLGQWEKYRSVARLCRALAQRDPEGTTPDPV